MNILLAQSAETAKGWVNILEVLIAGGVPLICLAVACVTGVAYWKQMKRNNDLETEWRKQVADEANERLVDQERLLREQLTREREGQDTVTAAVQAIEGFSHTLREQGVELRELTINIRDLSSAINESKQ